MLPPQAKKELIALLGPRGYLDRSEDLLLYEYDGSIDKARPEMVVFPRSTEDVVAIVKITREHNVTIVGRGAGTGLSGGAIPRAFPSIHVYARGPCDEEGGDGGLYGCVPGLARQGRRGAEVRAGDA